jgi:serine/threonine protein phosphatase PrpC
MAVPTLWEISALAKQLRLDVAQLTDVGRKREHNEDNMAFVIPKDSQVMASKGALFIVADGMGGHAAGEVASEIAVDTISNMYYQEDSTDVAVSLLRAIKRANASIHQRAAENLLRTGMGTTCVAAVLRGNMAYIANVGDSRSYLLRGNQVKQISQDHSWVAEQVRAGLLTEEQARTHAQRNVITRCLGTQAEVDVDIFHEELLEGDFLVLCTDGLSGLVSDEELHRIVDQFVPQESVYHLVERANENGGPDNITTIVVRVQEVGEEPPNVRYPVVVGGREMGEDTVTLGMFSDATLGAGVSNGEVGISSAPLRLSSGPLISSPDSITSPQPALRKQQRGRGRLFYATLAFIALLLFTLIGGGVFYYLKSNESQAAANQALDVAQQQITNVPTDPTSALKTLAIAQNTLADVQKNYQLNGAQQLQMANLQQKLVTHVKAAIIAYNIQATIFVLPCSNTSTQPLNNGSTLTYPQSIAFAADPKGAPFLYTLAQNNGLYEINSQSGLVSPPLTSGKSSPHFVSIAGNGSLLFLVEKQVNGNLQANYALNMYKPGSQGALGNPNTTQIDSSVLKGGYAPVFTTAWDNNVYVVLSSPSNPNNARVVDYVLSKGHLTSSKQLNFSISAPIVGTAAFPDQLFLLFASGEVQSLSLSSGSQHPLQTPVLMESPIAPPLATTNARDYNEKVSVPVVTPVLENGNVPLSVPSASPTSPAILTAGPVDGNPHLYIGDPANHRVLDLDSNPIVGGPATSTPTPTGTNVATNSIKLQLVRQYVSSTDLSQVKSLAANTQGLNILSQNAPSMMSQVSISTATPTGCVG